jgi:hypothetical protein
MPDDRLRALALFLCCLDFVRGCRNCLNPLVRPNKPQSINQLFVAFLAGLLWRQLTHDCLPQCYGVPIFWQPRRECKIENEATTSVADVVGCVQISREGRPP